ncbi:MAG: PAS domain S-box protein [Deltaproteobacteria bacterium]|nr:PAS domain S-box protein [Deltaproteobacteria bacterium]
MDKAEQTCPEENQDQIGNAKASTNSEMTLNGIPQKKTMTSLVLTIFSVLTYLLIFTLIYYLYGKGMAISAIIPVIVIGLLYGRVPGICAGILSYPINILMYVLFGAGWSGGMTLGGGGIPGTFGLILIGTVIGYASDLSSQLKKHRDKLDELVKRKTEELQASNTKLKETKEHLDNLIESSIDCIMVSDKTGYITKVNRYFLDLLGYSEEEVIGKHVMFCAPMFEEGTYESTTGDMLKIGKEFADDAHKMISILLEEGNVTNWEACYFRKDNKVVPIEQNIVCLYNRKGERTGAVAIIRDITERKKAEESLRSSEEYLENIIESSLDSIITTDKKGYVTRANKSFLKLLGHKKDEVLGRHMAEFSPMEEGTYESTIGTSVHIDKEFFDKILEDMSIMAREGKLSNLEFYLVRKDGKVIPVEENIVYFSDKEGNTNGAVGIIRDITEREKSGREIREGKEFLEKIIQGSKDGIVICDEKGDILSVNTSMEKLSGFKKKELIGKHTSILVTEEKGMREKILIKISELFEKGFTSYETLHKNKDGSFIEVECNTSVIKDEKGNPTAGVSIIRDITERKKMEQQLLQSEKLKSLGELAGGVAHDFNNVLAAILGRVQLLKIQFKPPSGKQEKRKSMLDLMKSLEIIERASLDGAETVRRIQEFSRKRTDDKNFTQSDINQLLDNALEFTSVRWKNEAESKGIKINIQKEYSSLPSTLGSAAELREVFTNLINNALDAMPQGGSIKIKTHKENSHILVKIEDTGAGIPEDIRNRIFDPFFTTKGVQSTGLGMSISYGIIHRHKGTIVVNSSEGKGTTFTIKLPILEKLLGEKGKVVTIPRRQRKARILVVDDEEDLGQLLSDILTSEGHEVEVASNGSQGIEMFKKKSFDMVFTDLGMPSMSGWEVAEKIKTINRRVPVALLTGWNIELKDQEMRDKNIDIVIHKPFEVERVLRSIHEVMVLGDRLKAV